MVSRSVWVAWCLLFGVLLATKLRSATGTHTAFGKASFKKVKAICNVTGTFASDYYAGRSGDGRVLTCMRNCFDYINLEHTPYKMYIRARDHDIPGDGNTKYAVKGYKAGVTGDKETTDEKRLLKQGREFCNW